MSEAVEAEIIEPEEASELTVAYSPAVIEANFDALEAHVRRLVADYEGATYDMGKDENVKAAKRDRAYLNGIAKEIDERRKAVSREYTKPLAAFEDRCKAVAGIAKQAADGIKAQLDEAEEEPAPAHPASTEGIRGEVTFDHVRFGYDPEKPGIKDFSAQVS